MNENLINSELLKYIKENINLFYNMEVLIYGWTNI